MAKPAQSYGVDDLTSPSNGQQSCLLENDHHTPNSPPAPKGPSLWNPYLTGFRFPTCVIEYCHRRMSLLSRFKLVYFVPASALASTKAAIFAAGAGRYPGPGGYTECCWQTAGTGQFRPGKNANPNIGSVGELESVEDVRVETL